MKEEEATVKYGPPLIQTWEDAQWQFLRGVIDEKELREAMGRFGQTHVSLVPVSGNLESLEISFGREFPDDLKEPRPVFTSLEDQQKELDERRKEDAKVVAQNRALDKKFPSSTSPEILRAEAAREEEEGKTPAKSVSK